MRRSLWGVLAVASFISTANAATTETPVWEAGLKAGFSSAHFSGGDVTYRDYNTSLVAGAFLTRRATGILHLQGELLYVVKGGKDASALDAVADVLTVKYLEMPLLAKVVVPMPSRKRAYYQSENGTRPFLYGGPTLSYRLSASGDRGEDTDWIKAIDYGLAFGGGFDVDVGGGKIVADARYTVGLRNVADFDPPVNMKNGVFTMMAGYVF